MKWLTDENISLPIVNEQRERGHDVYDINEQNLSGIADSEFFNCHQRRILFLLQWTKTSPAF